MTATATPRNAPNEPAGRKADLKERRTRQMLKASALQNAILNSAAFASIATDEKGVIQIFNAGAQRTLGYTGAEVVDRLAPADFFDPLQALERAKALSLEFGTEIRAGSEALTFKASRGIADRYEATCIRKDGQRLPAAVSVTALHEPKGEVIGYLLMVESIADYAVVPSAPEQRPATLEPVLPPRPSSALPRRSLLYVEDDPASVALVAQLIARRTDVLLLGAADADLGMELARTARPEVILMNIDLPGIGALQCMKRLRADPATQDTPILALSANAAPEAIAKGLEAGFFCCLTKPMEAEPFTAALEDALEFAARQRAEENRLPVRAAHSY